MPRTFFISSDRKVVVKLQEIGFIKEDTKTGRDTVGYREHLRSTGGTYLLYLREHEHSIVIDSKTMIELLEAIDEYEKVE